MTTGQDVEHRAINQVTALTEPLPYIETSPLKVTMSTTADSFRRQQFQDEGRSRNEKKSVLVWGSHRLESRLRRPPTLTGRHAAVIRGIHYSDFTQMWADPGDASPNLATRDPRK